MTHVTERKPLAHVSPLPKLAVIPLALSASGQVSSRGLKKGVASVQGYDKENQRIWVHSKQSGKKFGKKISFRTK